MNDSQPDINDMQSQADNDEEESKTPDVTPQGITDPPPPPTYEKIRASLVDMGNGCWTHHHFTDLIQTRQYRSPETIIGVPYDTSADIWSCACMIFEMFTGDFLFEPRRGDTFEEDDDHLAQMIELLGPMPLNFAKSGKHYSKFFDDNNHLKKIRGLNHWSLKKVLVQKYRMRDSHADEFASFLLPQLTYEPTKRATAYDLLQHPWLSSPSEDYLLTEEEHKKMMRKIELKQSLGIDNNEEGEEEYDNVSLLDESDIEKYNGDIDDDINGDAISFFGDDDEFRQPDWMHNSFTGGYANIDDIHMDKGKTT